MSLCRFFCRFFVCALRFRFGLLFFVSFERESCEIPPPLSLAVRGPRARERPRQLEQRLQTCSRLLGAELEAGGSWMPAAGCAAAAWTLRCGRGALLWSQESVI